MEVTTKQLRIEPGRIISRAAGGQEITVTYRGKPCAKIIPLAGRKNLVSEELPEYSAEAVNRGPGKRRGSQEDELFGLWKNRKDTENVEQFVRNARKGRSL